MKIKKYDNGLRLLQIPSQDTKAVTILFLFGVGSRYESAEINGISHFIEHMMFKGTKKRPTTLDISRELDSVGAEFNAMTAKDYTGYYIKIDAEKADLATDILSDMLLNTRFDARELNRERGVIIEEINMYKDNPLMHLETVFEESVFKGNSMARDVAGPVQVIKKVSRKQMVDYYHDHYRPDNLVIAVSGKIKKELIASLERKYIAKVKKGKGNKSEFKNFIDKQKSPRVALQYKSTKQVQMALGFPTFGYQDDDRYALHLLSIVLGGNMSSRLFISVRERKGLAYFVRAYPNFYEDAGNFLVHAGLDKSRLPEALKIIQTELKKIKNNGITADELKKARDYLRGKLTLQLEDSSVKAEYYAKQELLQGGLMSLEEKLKNYDKVTVKQIKEIATKYFIREKLNLAVIGPFKDNALFNKHISL